MEKKNKVGRPRKEKKFKRDKPFLLKMRIDEYEKINKLFLNGIRYSLDDFSKIIEMGGKNVQNIIVD